jgi:hypothetical protein
VLVAVAVAGALALDDSEDFELVSDFVSALVEAFFFSEEEPESEEDDEPRLSVL